MQKILYGKPVAEKIEEELTLAIEDLKKRNVSPTMAVILVGKNPASLTYVRAKEKKAQKLGISFLFYHLAEESSADEIISLIKKLNIDRKVHGIIIQLPLPGRLNQKEIIKNIDRGKDIDNLLGNGSSPAAEAVLEILKYYQIKLAGKIVLVGYGHLVGEPLKKILEARGFSPLVCERNTENLYEKLIDAEIVISATGVPGLIKPEMVNEKAVIVDAGTAESSGKTIGDVDSAVYDKVKAYTPVPGGVGPVTVVCLMRNLIIAIK